MKQLKILYTNIRSLHRNFDELLLVLQTTTINNYGILALSETWITEEQAKLYQIKGYKLFIQARIDGRRSGGVVMYVRNDLAIIGNEEVKMDTANALCIKLKMDDTYGLRDNTDSIITLILLYRDCTSSKAKFIRSLDSLFTGKEHNTLLVGDININILDENDSANYLNTMAISGFESIQNQPTRDNRCLDHVFVKSNKVIAQSQLHTLQITDHSMIEIEVQQKGNNDYVEQKSKCVVKILDENKFIRKLMCADWSWIGRECRAGGHDINVLITKLNTQIQGCYNKALKRVAYKKRKARQPWVTKELQVLAGRKSSAYRRHRANPENGDLRMEYKLLSTEVKRETRKAKAEYYNTQLNENMDNPKKYWEIVNGVRGINVNQDISEIRIGQDRVLVDSDPGRVAEEFNVYFNKVPETLLAENNFEMSDIKGTVQDLEDEENENENKIGFLENFTITVSDIEKIIGNIKNKRSSGHDGVSNYIVKQQPKFFAKILEPLFNESLKQGAFPEAYKISVIVPVYKSGEKDYVGNYRPISLLPTFSKLFESCVHEKLNNYLEHTQFYAMQQFGFQKGKSVDTALFEHISQITDSVESNKATMGVYLDLAKAFDTVNHKILLRKLKNAGIRGTLLKWFVSYLENRKHRVRIKGMQSNDCILKYGVPQGSVLGPLMWLIYINDFFALPLRAQVVVFADDTSLLYSEATVDGLESAYKYDFEELLIPWFRQNFLHLNISKCSSIVYGFKTPQWVEKLNMRISMGVIERVNETKYLGIILDEKLTWKGHSLYIQSKLRRTNYLFYHLKGFFGTPHLKKLYATLYESVYSYGIMHWGACKHIKPIKVLQNAVCRIILNHQRGSSESEIYEQMKVARVEELYKIRLLMFVFKNRLTFRLHDTEMQVRTRHGKSTVAEKVHWKKEHSRLQARYQGYLAFNQLPNECRSERRISTYKRLLKNAILPWKGESC